MIETNSRLYETNINNQGTLMKIVRYGGFYDVDIEFQDEFHYIKEHQLYSNFKSGGVKNPYDRTVYGVGYIGVGKHKVSINKVVTPVYKAWAGMLERCYSENMKHRNNTYFHISTVCEEWHNFQTFGDWYEKNKYEINERLHVEKDILVIGNQIYSPDTCLLVPQVLNTLFINKSNNRGLPNGIIKQGNGYLAKYNHEHLGIYETVEKAYEVYAIEKKKNIVMVANQYKDKIPSKLYEALLNYEFRIENDRNYIAA